MTMPYGPFPAQTLYTQSTGMSLRDHFAGQALAAMKDLRDEGDWSQSDDKNGLPDQRAEWVAAACYRYADALLAHRNTETPKHQITETLC
jgi:hypothetical protein